MQDASEIDDQRVLALPRVRGRFRATGLDFDGPWAAVITVREGRIAHAAGYATKPQALRALGLG